MLGFDFTRQPHPAALAVVSPFISGAVFLAGIAYFRWNDAVKMFADPNLTNTGKLVIAVIISYAVGLLLSTVISGPFFIVSYLSGYIIASVIIMVIRRRLQQAWEPSKQASFRRAVQAALDPSLIPSSAEEYATQFTQRVLAQITANPAAIGEEACQKIGQEAVKLFTDHYDLQWKNIHNALYKIEGRKHPMTELYAFEPTASIAGAILIWGWLSFKVPPALHLAAISTFIIFGVMLIIHGLSKAADYVDAVSIQSLLFDEMLERHRTAKVAD